MIFSSLGDEVQICHDENIVHDYTFDENCVSMTDLRNWLGHFSVLVESSWSILLGHILVNRTSS